MPCEHSTPIPGGDSFRKPRVGFIKHYSAYTANADPKLVTQRFLAYITMFMRFTNTPHLPYLKNLFYREFSVSNSSTLILPTPSYFFHHVLHVSRMCSRNKMIRVYARRVVAGVCNFTSVWNLSLGQSVGKLMGIFASAPSKPSVTVIIDGSKPKNASIRLWSNGRFLESFFRGWNPAPYGGTRMRAKTPQLDFVLWKPKWGRTFIAQFCYHSSGHANLQSGSWCQGPLGASTLIGPLILQHYWGKFNDSSM